MSEYNTLWNYIQKSTEPAFKLTFGEIGEIAGLQNQHERAAGGI